MFEARLKSRPRTECTEKEPQSKRLGLSENEFQGKETSIRNKTLFAVDKDADSARKSETFSVSSASRRYPGHYSTHK